MAIASNLKAMEKTRLRKVRTMTVPGDVLVKVGDEVGADTVIAKTEFVRGNPRMIDLHSEFRKRLPMDVLQKTLLKKVGDKVTSRDILARYQEGYWSDVYEVAAPCDGTIEYISITQARIIIREDPKSAKPMAIVPAAQKLSVWPFMLRMFTAVKEGDQVYEGQVLASALNLTTMDYVYAPMSGVVEKICTKTGTITIVRPIRPAQVQGHIAGRVTGLVADRGAVVEATGSYVEGIFGVGGERHGELVIAADGPNGELDEAGVLPGHKGKVLLAGSLVSLEALQKMRALGAQGVIAGGLNNIDLVQVFGHEITAGITGQEQSDFTAIVMEGFGRMPMGPAAWDLLASRAGRVASIDGTTQIRAGVLRPQVIVSDGSADLDSMRGEAMGTAAVEPMPRATSLTVGDRVKCVRQPYPGLWGVVAEIPPEPEKVGCEAFLDVARVRLDDGRLVTVAEANLEVIRAATAAS